MRKFFILLTGLLFWAAPLMAVTPAMRTVVDMAGVSHQLPVKVSSYYCMSAVGSLFLYTLNPDKLAGWVFPIGEREAPYIGEKYRQLPVLGGWAGTRSNASVEQIALVHPDLIVSFGELNEEQIEMGERFSAQTGIPVLYLSMRLEDIAKSYRLLGQITGDEARAEELAAFSEMALSEVDSALSSIKASEQVRVYYAQGPDGLLTDPAGSWHTEVLSRVKGVNVADVPLGGKFGRSKVSIEQLLLWDPTLIISGYDRYQGVGLYEQYARLPQWRSVRAVQNKQVYAIPSIPFDWFDRPPSVNRIIGVTWLANLLYPERYPVDMAAKTRQFYRTFYRHSLNDAQLERVLSEALRPE